jgi:hypothetical protein
MGRIARSWELTKQSYRILMQDKELILLPVISGAIILVICGSFFFGLGLHQEESLKSNQIGVILPVLAMYIVSYTAAFFFQAALVAGACQRMAGGDPTLGSALGAASKRFGAILAWGVIAGTVGMVLRAIQERSQTVGKIVVGLMGVAWSLATYFMVPVLVMEEQTVAESFKRSAALFKKTWGETVAGNVSLGLISFLVMLPVIALAFLLASSGHGLVAMAIAVPVLALVGVFFSALNGVYLASVYRYATTGETGGYDQGLLTSAFQPKKTKG